ncbi:MAG: hypothetical protein KJ645_10460 [Planctomycetes bacterium]|nr:hypothetical protein [Planctomycetota bacterium]
MIGLLFLLCGTTAAGQDYITFYRGDEVGPRSIELDEEAFMNILSFRQPLESIQPWLASGSGYRGAVGSLTARDLWMEHEMKHRAEVSDSFAVSAIARQAVDFDSQYVFIQPTLEYRLSSKFEIIAPFIPDADKGGMDTGLGFRFRDPDEGLDYLQMVYIRADFLFNHHSRTYGESRAKSPADTLELQAQGATGDLGRMSLKIAYQLPSDIRYSELGRNEEYRRFSAWFLDQYDLDDGRLFFEFEQESMGEEVQPLTLASEEDAFRGGRDMSRVRLEYQRDLSEDRVRRFRGGVQYLYFDEDEDLPEKPAFTHTMLRREVIFYGGYRMPLGSTEGLSLETTVYLDRLNNRNRFIYNPGEDGRDPGFQGKINFSFLWVISDRVDFVLDPSFELDTLGWGGGGAQLRCLF